MLLFVSETFATSVVARARAECANVIGRARQADQEKIAFVKRDKQVPLHGLWLRISLWHSVPTLPSLSLWPLAESPPSGCLCLRS